MSQPSGASLTIVVAIGLLHLPGQAFGKGVPPSGNLSGVMGLTSDYSPRGIEQSDGKPAVHAEVSYNDITGIYTTIGVTNINYSYDRDAYAEVDVFAGYKRKIFDIDFDFGGAQYIYPGTFDGNDYTFYEVKIGASKSFDFATFTAAIQYTPDYWVHTGKALYIPVSATVPIKNGFSLIAGGAHQSLEDNAKLHLPDWWHWYGGVSYNYNQYMFSAKYMDTDISKSDCSDDCDPRYIFTALRFF